MILHSCTQQRRHVVMCMLKGIYVLKHNKVEPCLDHRGLPRFNYNVQWGQGQTAGISGRQDVYSCILCWGRKEWVGMGGQEDGQSPPLPSILDYFGHLLCCSKLGS